MSLSRTLYACIDNPMVTGRPRHAARIGRREALLQLAKGTLVVEYMRACFEPLKTISTPAFVDSETPPALRLMRHETRLIDVLSDQMAGIHSDRLWVELVGLLTKTAEGCEWLRQRALEHAEYHAEAEAYGDAE